MIVGYNGRDGVITDANGLLYMRARYYSPELRRFINADIIPGEISDSTSLNRYAYVNGNPVSYVDPFGLKGFWSGLWNGVKKVAKKVEDWCDKTINNIANSFKKTSEKILTAKKKAVKAIENFALFSNAIDDRISNPNLFGDIFYKYTYKYNKAHDKIGNSTDDLIKNQNDPDVKHLKVGVFNVGYSGCETVAVYNAKILLGDTNVSLADTIKSFEKEHALTFQYDSYGFLGGNPYSISKVLSNDGIKYETIKGFSDIREPGIYIVSYWNSLYYSSMIHTITIEITSDSYTSYNGRINYVNDPEFIAGYKVSRK